MQVEVLYFASLREAVGVAQERIALPEHVRDVTSLRAFLHARGGVWQALAPQCAVRAAVNRTMATPDTRLGDGDEVAFFPPVTGG